MTQLQELRDLLRGRIKRTHPGSSYANPSVSAYATRSGRAEPPDDDNRGAMIDIDVLIIAALKEEFEAARDCVPVQYLGRRT